MKKNIILSILFLVVLSQIGLASISILVRESGQPLVADEIKIYTDPIMSKEDISSYEFPISVGGLYKIEITKYGYETNTRTMYILADPNKLTQTIEMKKAIHTLTINTTNQTDDNVIVDYIKIYKNNQEVLYLDSDDINSHLTDIDLQEGTYEIEILQTDYNAFREEISLEDDTFHKIILVSDPPYVPAIEITISSPVKKIYQFDTVFLDYDTTGHPETIWYNVDDGENITTKNIETISGLSEGRRRITVFANDSLGREYSEFIAFDVYLPIEINIIANRWYDTQDVDVSYELTKGNPDTFWFNVDNGENITLDSTTIPLRDLSEQDHVLNLFANNSGGIEYHEFARIDIHLPFHIDITSPSDQSYETKEITLSYGTNHEADMVWYNINDGENETISGPVGIVFEQGEHTINIFANETDSGMEDQDSVTFNIILPIELSLINQPVYNTRNIGIQYSVVQGEPNQVWYNLNYSNANITLTSNTISLVSLPDGNYDLTVYSNNSLGTETEKTISFNVAVPVTTYTPTSSGGGGGGGYIITSMNIDLQKEIIFNPGENTLEVPIENKWRSNINSLKLKIDKLPKGWTYLVEPKLLSLEKEFKRSFTVKLNIPENETGNHTVWFEAKSGGHLKRFKATLMIQPEQEEPETPEIITDQSNVPVEEQQQETNPLTGLITGISEINLLHAAIVVIILTIITSMVYIYFKEIEQRDSI